MKKAWVLIMTYIVGVGIANAAVRDINSVSRGTTTQKSTISPRTNTYSPRSTPQPVATRTSSAITQKAKNTSRQSVANTATRNTQTTPVRTTSRNATPQRTKKTTDYTTTGNKTKITTPAITTRATANNVLPSNTFGSGYNACRDAYFTCMDQFCATQNETYHRCTCSSKLSQIKSRENLLSDTANQLQDFKDFNLSVIDKSTAEVSAMINASTGETIASTKKDTSASAQQLANIGAILSNAKSQSLSTAGTLDIGGNIKQIWQTTSLADGANIANLTGESLYNAVHAQCSQMVTDICESKSTLNMVVSAYGMYIENDCTALSNSLDSKTTTAKGYVRDTEREMHTARLENYNAHNATSINDCIANVRADLTADSACGPNYIHCLDVTGRYLNRDTGAPIYSADFYQLDGLVSLSGNILTNQTNRMIVSELNRMRFFAESSLDTCRDISDEVWDEFVRQAITEIYQGQQERIRNVKNECLDVVNACYDEQNQSLKDFSNIKEQLLLGQRLELSEELCREKLEACSNLYGGGPNGLAELLNAMHDLTDSKLAKGCHVALQEFVQEICAVPSMDTLHQYPYACRVYTPGDQQYAQNYACNQQLWKNANQATDVIPIDYSNESSSENCGNYVGSLYQRLVRYALQSCVRPSDANTQGYTISTDVLADVNTVMDSVRVDMGIALAAECERLGGTWIDTVWIDEADGYHDITGDALHKRFYNETGANTNWGYCKSNSSTSGDDGSTDG